MPLVLLTIRGRVSGELRTTPAAVQPDGDRLVVVGSMGGLPTHPQWYQNLDADPNITVEYRGDRYAAVARTVEPGEEAPRSADPPHDHCRRACPAMSSARPITA